MTSNKLVTPSPTTATTTTPTTVSSSSATTAKKLQSATANLPNHTATTTVVPRTPSHIYTKSEATIKAEARAYALYSSSSSSRSGSKRKSSSAGKSNSRHQTAASTAGGRSKASLPLHASARPEKQRKLNSTSTTTTTRKMVPPSSEPLTKVPQTNHPGPTFPLNAKEGDEYYRFVQSLGLDDSFFSLGMEDDEDFHLSDDDDDEDDDNDYEQGGLVRTSADKEQGETAESESTPVLSSPLSASPMKLPEWDPEFYKDLEEELGSLLEEDYESAVTTLLTSRHPGASSPSSITSSATNTNNGKSNASAVSAAAASTKVESSNFKSKRQQQKQEQQQMSKQQQQKQEPQQTASPTTPLREASRHSSRTPVTAEQFQHLRRLLGQHYQLLIQQSVLAIRAAHAQKSQKDGNNNKIPDFFLSGETADDLAELLDGAVGMLQDLDQNRKDAIRNFIQLETTTGNHRKTTKSSSDDTSLQTIGRRSLLPQFTESEKTKEQAKKQAFLAAGRRLTRAAFTKTLKQQKGGSGQQRTSFDIPGLDKLNETFAIIDQSVDQKSSGNGKNHANEKNILQVQSHADACQMVLRHVGATIEENFIPGSLDASHHFCDPTEYLGPGFSPPCHPEQEMFIRRNRNLFTSGEDNLVLRGVNLYGEKQWILIADRYLPDRSVNIISQRYSKLCVMLYKAHGIAIDANGNLNEPPKLESVDDIDEEKVTQLGLQRVQPPAILNVHRWSLEEDLTLLKAVPLMGHMWAELGARLIPHRDRGHLRKRYQVLERRVKATITRSAKGEMQQFQKQSLQQQSHAGTCRTNSKSVVSKSQNRSTISKDKNAAQKAPPMSLERAAASLTLLRPAKKAQATGGPAFSVHHSNGTTKKVAVKRSAAAVAAAAPTTKKRKTPTAQGKVGRTKANTKVAPPAAAKASIPVPPASTLHSTTLPSIDSNLSMDQGCSRSAFERLVDGSSEEWSQMSRMKKILENDTESLVADATASHLSKAPGHSEISRLPQMQMDTISLSGLSVLQSSESFGIPMRPGGESSSPKKAPSAGISIMASVLERTSKNDKSRASVSRENFTLSDSIADVDQTESGIMESPKKRKPSTAVPSTPVPPSTPQQSTIFSISGTPIGLSPGFRPFPDVLPRNGGNSGIALTPNPHHRSLQPPTSATSGIVRNLYTTADDDADFRFCNFEISDQSRQEMEATAAKGIPPKHDRQLRHRNGISMSLLPSFGAAAGDANNNSMNCASLMCAHDLEGALALNSLSNSPARSFVRRQEHNQETDATNTTKRSLFATVVEGRNSNDGKKETSSAKKT